MLVCIHKDLCVCVCTQTYTYTHTYNGVLQSHKNVQTTDKNNKVYELKTGISNSQAG